MSKRPCDKCEDIERCTNKLLDCYCPDYQNWKKEEGKDADAPEHWKSKKRK